MQLMFCGHVQSLQCKADMCGQIHDWQCWLSFSHRYTSGSSIKNLSLCVSQHQFRLSSYMYMHLVSSNNTGSVKTWFAFTAQAEHVSKTILFRKLLFPTLHCLIDAFNSVLIIIWMLSPSLNEKLKWRPAQNLVWKSQLAVDRELYGKDISHDDVKIGGANNFLLHLYFMCEYVGWHFRNSVDIWVLYRAR